jgi:membrane associated rhomboid family serine protease
MADGAEVALETTPDEANARDWGLALVAAGVPARVEQRPSGWTVLVPDGDLGRARAALADYLAEAVATPESEFEYGPTWMGVLIAAALVAIAPFTGFRAAGRPSFLAGEGVAVHIITDQPWRAVTALTLHADTTHLLGNVLGMAVLATPVCRLLGPGLGLALIVMAGASGNLLNAVMQGAPHVFVGASTAIFGAVGILAGMAFLRAHPTRRQGWVPLAAGLALLGFLGTGEHADLLAHFLGFQMGVGLGMGCAVSFEAPPGPRAQRWLAIGTIAVVAGSWLLALHSAHTVPPPRR